MLRWLALIAAIGSIAGGLVFYLLTAPQGLTAETLATLPDGDAGRGETLFWAGGCASCHAAAKAKGDDRFRLGGGLVLKTEFGDFVTPNISSHGTDGIGAWSLADFATAILRGVSPDGRHYYPSFPYGSYARMTTTDVSDLWAFLQTLPAVEGRVPGHTLAFPFNIRRGVGMWKLMYFDDSSVIDVAAGNTTLLRGQYLVEGPSHCGECHTPRDFAGGMIRSKWLSGAPAPDGPGRIPNITGGEGGIGSWSASDIAYYLETGFTPDFDSVGGAMVEVQRNMAELAPKDRAAIAAYLKAVPKHATAR